MTIIARLRALTKDAAGQDLLEYALLIALIALVGFGAVQLTAIATDDKGNTTLAPAVTASPLVGVLCSRPPSGLLRASTT